MEIDENTLCFIREHRNDDVRVLALQAHRYPSIDMSAALTQIAGWKVMKEKVPAWAGNEYIYYPAHLPLEQCSSEVTARYKAELIQKSDTPKETFTDLTGGFGIDCAFISAAFRQATYVERQEELCQIAAHNFPLLELNHIAVCHEDSIRHLETMPPVDWIFIDPARRDEKGGKTVAISDCEPDVSLLEERLLQKASHVMIKLSPMLDLSVALSHLKHIQEVHIVSVGNECKELLLVLSRQEVPDPQDVPIHCVNLSGASPVPPLTFTRRLEKECGCPCASTLRAYLYEPNASILKAGAFRCLTYIYKVEKLHPNSHLYTSGSLIPDFPGRRFQIVATSSLHKKEVKELLGAEKKANLTVRNFPATVAELRKRLKLAEGGDIYLFATTLADEQKILIRCLPVTAL